MKAKTKPFFSSTAEMVCLLRAKSFNERREYYKSDDYISVLISNSAGSLLSRVRSAFVLSCDGLAPLLPVGLYEYIIARTRYVDNLFQALPADITQVFILGAGYDSRGFRFQKELGHCQVYECDHPDMQKKKQQLLQKMEIDFPVNVHFIPINFSDNSFYEFINNLHIMKNDKCFFLLEGLLMYLSPQQVETLLFTINTIDCRQCRLFFDYVYAGAIRGDTSDNNAADSAVKVDSLGEPWRFGMEPGEAGNLLRAYGFSLLEELTGPDMERIFFSDRDGKSHGRVMGSVALVLAERTGTATTD